MYCNRCHCHFFFNQERGQRPLKLCFFYAKVIGFEQNKTKTETFHSTMYVIPFSKERCKNKSQNLIYAETPFQEKNVHVRRFPSSFIHEKQGRLGTISLTNSRKFATPREMRSEEWAQKSPLMSRALPKYGKCYWLVEANFPCHTTQICECDVAVKPVVPVSRKFGCFSQARLPWPN